jgi:DHA1 family inner membrane transport protein
VPQQHRIVGIAPQIAPIVLGLNNSAVFLGTTTAGIVGAAGIQVLGTEKLGFISAVLVTAALIVSEFAARRIAAFNQGIASSESSLVLPVSAAGQAEG